MAQRVEAGAPERLVGVDVADPGQEGLVEEERLEPRPPGAQAPPEDAQREVGLERLRAVLRERDRQGVRVVGADAGELAHVAQAQLAPVGEGPGGVHVRDRRSARRARR